MTASEWGPNPASNPPAATYILPLRWTSDEALDGLVAYLQNVSAWLPVIVVDGSPEALYREHAQAFPPAVLHVRPRYPDLANGKVAGVLTGLEFAQTDKVILADDDVRYTADALTRVVWLLDRADAVRPQNYFLELPWHARWDTGRTLLNRALAGDYPGTLGLRRAALQRTAGYDGNVLFENLELLRTVRAGGGTVHRADDLFVGRLPPTTRHFLGQRVRQAYDDFAQPLRLTVELALLPGLLAVLRMKPRTRAGTLLAAVGASVAIAEFGRRRRRGGSVFAPSAALWAPAWLLERGVCIWAALLLLLRGGVPYSGNRLRVAAHSVAELRRGLQLAGPPDSPQGSDHVEPVRV
ncbi:MAG: hypothetical protein JWO93_933 [Micrococcaceae bacterium]|nr:hypothetical protein [Micrococcaceae bacterium]